MRCVGTSAPRACDSLIAVAVARLANAIARLSMTTVRYRARDDALAAVVLVRVVASCKRRSRRIARAAFSKRLGAWRVRACGAATRVAAMHASQ